MAEAVARVLGALEEGRFFGREAHLRDARRLARDTSRGWGRSVLLAGGTGTGKTELLRQIYLALYREDGTLFPFYYAFPRLAWGLEDFARDFACRFAAHYLAFVRREPSLVTARFDPEELADRLRNEGGDAGEHLAGALGGVADPVPGSSPSLEASLLPHRFASASGWRALLLLDDIRNLDGYTPGALAAWSREALRSRVAPAVVAVRDEAELDGPLGEGGGGGLFRRWSLGPLEPDEAGRMMQGLLRVAGLHLDDGVAVWLLRQTGGFPPYLEAAVRSLEAGRVDAGSVLRAYSALVCGGELRDYWLEPLNRAFPSLGRRRAALDVLVACLAEKPPPDPARLATRMLADRDEVEAAVAGLRAAGMLGIECARIVPREDPVLRDVALSLYRRETAGIGPGMVEAELAAEKMKELEASPRRAARERLRSRLTALLESWSGQAVPRTLFSAADFGRDFGDEAPDGALERLREEKEAIRLPRVVAATAGLRLGEGTLPSLDVDAAAWGFRGERADGSSEVCWVAKVTGGAPVEAAEVEAFDRAVTALQTRGDLSAGRLVRWFVAVDGFAPAAVRAAARRRILTSTAPMMEALELLLGRDQGPFRLGEPPRAAGAEEMEFEMTIPMVSETELVAARAVEQLAENMRFDEAGIGKIKMALVEACINAFEHSGLPGGKVRLLFSVGGESLRIRVENEGARFAPERVRAAAGGGASMKKRGWGLKLIRELMDEVTFESREEGSALVMEKYLSGKEGIRE